jgi:hypothetical protein
LIIGGHPKNVVQVLSVHGQDQVEIIEVGTTELSCPKMAKVNSVQFGRLLHPSVRGVSDVPASGTGRVNLEISLDTGFKDFLPKHTLRERAAADVSEADKENSHAKRG